MTKLTFLAVGLIAGGLVSAADFDPEAVYKQTCHVCHGTGVAGAPKFGDKAGWDAKIKAAGGKEQLIQNGIKGINAMPPKGGATLSDADFAKVVDYMVSHSQ